MVLLTGGQFASVPGYAVVRLEILKIKTKYEK